MLREVSYSSAPSIQSKFLISQPVSVSKIGLSRVLYLATAYIYTLLPFLQVKGVKKC